MNYIAQIRKALVPVGVGGVLAFFASFGIGAEMTVGEAVEIAVISLLVWAIPNRPVK